jgi:hypothetical protein
LHYVISESNISTVCGGGDGVRCNG